MNELAFLELLRAIKEDAWIDAATKARIERAAQQIGRRHGSKRMEVRERRQLARDLLCKGLDKVTVRARLIVAFEVAERTAYRDVEWVAGRCQNTPKNGSEKAETVTNEEVAEQERHSCI
jgi:hypothetical protein